MARFLFSVKEILDKVKQLSQFYDTLDFVTGSLKIRR